MELINKLTLLLKKYWFYLLLIPIIVLYFFNNIIAIILIIIFLIALIIYYFIFFNFRKKILSLIKEYKVIEDRAVADELKSSLPIVKEKMRKLIEKQEREEWLIISVNDHYIFFNENIINKFIELYKRGMNEKEIFEEINREEEVFKSRREVKIIEEELMRQHKIFPGKKDMSEDRVTSEVMD